MASLTEETRGRKTEKWHLCMLICWQIWKTRCKLVYVDKVANMEAVSRDIMRTRTELASQIIRTRRRATPCPVEQWRTPEEGQIKINVDATYVSSSRQGAVRVIVRDHEVRMMYRWHGRSMGDSTEELEATTLLQGIQIAVTYG